MRLFELKRHVSRRLSLGRRVGAIPPGEELQISVLLHPKDDQALAAAVARVCDPKSPGYGKFLSRDEIRALVSPGYQDYDAVVAWLHNAGLRTQDPSGIRTIVHATGTAEVIQKALAAPIGQYRFGLRRTPSYALEQNPAIPAALAPLVRGIAGLNDLPAARLFPTHLAPIRSKVPRRGPSDSRGPGGGYTPETIRSVYSVPEDGGGGQRVGILQFGGGFSASDFETFCGTYGLPAGDVTERTVRGGRNDYRGRTGDADVEVAMDMDWVRAIAPRAAIDVFFAPNVDRGWVDFLGMLLDLPDGQRPGVVSISWGMPEDGFATSRRYDQTRQLFLSTTLLGISFVSASGDAGAADDLPSSPTFDGQRHVDFPSVIPEVTSVGGTRLRGTAEGFTETVWNDGLEGGASGGGFSRFVRVPAYQEGYLGKRPGVAGRGVPDVAAVASPDPGLSIHVHKAWLAAGGTSVAAPIWAGFLAQVNAARVAAGRPRLGAANPALYALHGGSRKSSPFRDVTEGDNGFGGVPGFTAGAGWDAATGLGSADLSKLIKAL